MNAHTQLKAYLDQELLPEERRDLENALATSPELREELAALQRLSDALMSMRETPEPVGKEQTRAAVAARVRPQPWYVQSRSWLQLAAAGTCCLVIAAVVFPVFAQSKSASKRLTATTALERAATRSPMTESMAVPGDAATLEAPAAQAPSVSAASGMAVPMSDRAIQRFGQLGLRVDSVPDAVARITAMAAAERGFVEASDTRQEEEYRVGSLLVRVPSNRFDATMIQLRELGEVQSEATSGKDVTGQLVDLEARLRVLRAEEISLLEILRQARRLGDVLTVRDRLSNVRGEIESIDAQRKAMRSLADLSTIQISLSERPGPRAAKSENWVQDTWTVAVNGLQNVGRFLAQIVIVLFVFAPVWLVPLGVAWWLGRRRS